MTTEGVAGAISGKGGTGWSLLERPAVWDELILPEVSHDLLRSISADGRFRRRDGGNGRAETRLSPLRLMFAGEPGTGKLLAARVLATDLGLALVRVELGQLLAGPTSANEEQLAPVFDSPELIGAIVYLADAGAWLGEHSGRLNGREAATDADVAAVLARIDAHHGIVIFAASLGIASPAVTERLDHVVEFPFPDERGRRDIWAQNLSRGAQAGDRELDFLAFSFQLTGGAIRRCCVAGAAAAAAERVPLELRHLVAGVEREYRGRLQSARARDALERFYGQRWASEPPLPTAPARRVAPALPRTRPARGGRLRLALCVAAVLVAAVAGFLIAHRSGSSPTRPPALSQPFSAGVLRVHAPTGWQQRASSVSGLQDELAISPARGAGEIVLGRTTTTTAGTLPAALLANLPHAPGAAVVTLDGAKFYRYLGLESRDGSGPESVYVLPTSVGTVVAECLERGAPAGFASTCERVVSTLRLSSGTALAIGPSASYASGLDRAMAVLTTRVAEAAGRLHAARTPQAQARAANGAAVAYLRAASTVDALNAGVASADNQSVASALRSIATGYASLRSAALRDDAAGFARAERTITSGQRGLQSAIAELAKLGYSVS